MISPRCAPRSMPAARGRRNSLAGKDLVQRQPATAGALPSNPHRRKRSGMREKRMSLKRWSVFGAMASVLAIAGANALAQGGAQTGDDWVARLPQGPGRAEFAASCSKCHAIGTVTAKPKSAADWDETLAKMKKQGLIIPPADEAAVRSYLLAHYQAKEGAMGAP
ncbi:hypothetical protein E4T56_gene20727, partial [Termitomyces sp. T112]